MNDARVNFIWNQRWPHLVWVSWSVYKITVLLNVFLQIPKCIVPNCKIYVIWKTRWPHLVWASSNVVLAQCCPVHCPWSCSLLLLHISRFAKLSLAFSILSCLWSSLLPSELRVASLALCCKSSLALCPSQYAHALFPKTSKEVAKKLKKRSQQGPQGGLKPRVSRFFLLPTSFYQLSEISYCNEKDKRRGKELKEVQDQSYLLSHLNLSWRRRRRRRKRSKRIFCFESILCQYPYHCSLSYCAHQEAS